jgi:protein-disulfide isomerase
MRRRTSLLVLPLLLVAGCTSSNREAPAASREAEKTTPAAVEQPAPAPAEPACNRGNADAPVRLEVFSDYECPVCRAFYLQTMKQIFTDYADKGKVCVVYREFPTYEHSREAARYARASLRVGAPQWGRVVEAFYQTQPDWSKTGDVEGVVAKALSPEDFALARKYAQDTTLEKTIDDDAIEGLQREVKGTPTSFITMSGKTEKVDGALTFASMQRHLEGLP